MLTSYGNAGNIGASGSVSFSPTADPSWPAGVFQLAGFSVSWTDASTGQLVVVRDMLTLPQSYAASLSSRDYQADFTFIPAKSINATVVEPVVYIASGNVQKHSAPPSALLNVLPKPVNYATVRMTAAPLFLPGGGIMAVTLSVSNVGSPIDTRLSGLLLNASSSSGFTPVPGTVRATAGSPITSDPVSGPSSIGWSGLTLAAGAAFSVSFNISVASYSVAYVGGYGIIYGGVVDASADMQVSAARTRPCLLRTHFSAPHAPQEAAFMSGARLNAMHA